MRHIGFDPICAVVPFHPGGCGLRPPDEWQATQSDVAPWLWQAAQDRMFCRAAAPWTEIQPAGCGSRMLPPPGATPWNWWQLWQYPVPWHFEQLTGSAAASMAWREIQ